jgi:hypothetical protein
MFSVLLFSLALIGCVCGTLAATPFYPEDHW